MIRKNKIICVLLSFIIALSSLPMISYAGTPNIPKSFSVGLGGILTIPVDLSNCSGKQKKWKINGDGSVATISSNGDVTGNNLGTVSAYCSTSAGEIAICKVTVVPSANISIDKANVSLKISDTVKLNNTVFPENAIQNVIWNSQNNSVATVTNDGIVTAVGKGFTKITCISTDGTNNNATCNITVIEQTTKPLKKQRKNKSTTKKRKAEVKTTTAKKETVLQTDKTTKKKIKSTPDNSVKRNEDNITEAKTTAASTTKKITSKINLIESTTASQNESENEFDINNGDESVADSEYSLFAISKSKKPIQITWNKLESVSGYELYQSDKANLSKLNLIYDGPQNYYNKHLYVNGKSYFFVVRGYSFNDKGEKVYMNYSKAIYIKAVNKSIIKKIFDKLQKDV